jgi:hypothetical protein
MYNELLTDPRSHDENSFAYIVNGFVSMSNEKKKLDVSEFEGKVKRIVDSSKFYNASIIGRIPKQVASEKLGYENEVKHLSTFGRVGLIVKPHEESIHVAYNGDMLAPVDEEMLGWYANRNKGKIKNPKNLLTKSLFGMYNHIIIKGDENTRIEGIFCQCLGKDDNNVAELKAAAEKVAGEDLPIVDVKGYKPPSIISKCLYYVNPYAYMYATFPFRFAFDMIPLSAQKKLGML